jgi:alkylation response protein AidB-like acyl-CoA dehydrogenase
MSQPASSITENTPRPLTSLTDEETLFRQSVREFAEQQVRPLASEMDEKGKFAAELLQQLFELGLMGIEVPEEYGGQGGTFFNAILAVEEMSRVDASAGVMSMQNTLVNNASCAGETRTKEEISRATNGRHRRSLCLIGSWFGQRCIRAYDKGRG